MIESIKKTLALFGIRDLVINFDIEHRCIKAEFFCRGQMTEKIIPFDDIEDAFRDTEITNETASNSAEQPTRDTL